MGYSEYKCWFCKYKEDEAYFSVLCNKGHHVCDDCFEKICKLFPRRDYRDEMSDPPSDEDSSDDDR